MLPSRESKKKRMIEMKRNGANIRDIAKDVQMSFRDIGKIIREGEGQKEPIPEKSNTFKAFQLFSKGEKMVNVAIKLDLNPMVVEDVHQSYLRLQGLDEIVSYCEKVKPHIPGFLRFVEISKNYSAPERQKIVDIFTFHDVITNLENKKNQANREYIAECNRRDSMQKEVENLIQE